MKARGLLLALAAILTATTHAPDRMAWGQVGPMAPADSYCDCDPGIEADGYRTDPYWVRAEFLTWWSSGMRAPPLVATGPQSSGGIVGEPGTAVLFGDHITIPAQLGGRFTAGFWCDDCQTCGYEADFFFLGRGTRSFNASSDGDPLLARPFFDVNAGVPSVEQVANLADPNDPDLLPVAGRIAVATTSQLLGTQFNRVRNFSSSDDPLDGGASRRIDVLTGFRFLALNERIAIREDLRIPDESVLLPGMMFLVDDQFAAANYFYGLQLGIRSDYRWERWNLSLSPRLAVGWTDQTVNIRGRTTVDDPTSPPPVTFDSGFLAASSNIGRHHRDLFTFVPEVTAQLGYWLTPQLQFSCGYNFLYWNNVVRPGQHINPNLDVSQVPPGTAAGPVQPLFGFAGTGFWAQGIQLGLDYRF